MPQNSSASIATVSALFIHSPLFLPDPRTPRITLSSIPGNDKSLQEDLDDQLMFLHARERRINGRVHP